MRVITEEKLKKIAQQYGENSITESIIFGILIHELQNLEQLTGNDLKQSKNYSARESLKFVMKYFMVGLLIGFILIQITKAIILP